MSIDSAHEAAQRLCDDVRNRLVQIETEQDARFQLIDRFLTEVLGWDHADVKTEPHSESGYADYLLTSRNQNQMVIEAKRTGRLLLDTVDPQVRWYKVGGPALKSAKEGIEQGLQYSIDHGVNYTVLTTGLTWIAWRPWPGSGISFREGRALVFPDLKAILDSFAVFYDMFSKSSVIGRSYTVVLPYSDGAGDTSGARQVFVLVLQSMLFCSDQTTESGLINTASVRS
jgi:hypothetical protein